MAIGGAPLVGHKVSARAAIPFGPFLCLGSFTMCTAQQFGWSLPKGGLRRGATSVPLEVASAVRPHAVLSAGTSSLSYDANGSQLTKSVGGTATRTIAADASE